MRATDTFVQLVGVPHPSPAKAKEFRTIDLASARAGIEAARSAHAMHFIYALERFPPTRESALRLGFVTLEQMVTALTWAVEHPSKETRIIEVPDIRKIAP